MANPYTRWGVTARNEIWGTKSIDALSKGEDRSFALREVPWPDRAHLLLLIFQGLALLAYQINRLFLIDSLTGH